MRRFTTDASHELRTPLTAMRSVGEIGLRAQRDDAEYRNIIGSMLEEVDRLSLLVDRLLTLSRAETRQSTLSRDAVDLSALADDVGSDRLVLAEEKQQTLTIDLTGVAGRRRRSTRAAAGADQPRRQRDQVHAGAGRVRIRSPRRRRTHSSRSSTPGPASSDARERSGSLLPRERLERQRNRTRASRWPRVRSKRSAATSRWPAPVQTGSVFRISLPRHLS